jgi:hypothetical protein
MNCTSSKSTQENTGAKKYQISEEFRIFCAQGLINLYRSCNDLGERAMKACDRL